MKTVILRPSEVRDRESLHAAFARQLSFPDWYGANLDALYDLLSAMPERVWVTLVEPERLRKQLGDSFEGLLRMLGDLDPDRVRLWSLRGRPVRTATDGASDEN